MPPVDFLSKMHITFNRKCSWKAATGAGGDAAPCERFWLACVRPWFWSQGPSVKSRIQMWPTTPPHGSFFWLSGNLPSLSLSISPCSWRERGSEPIPTLIPLPPIMPLALIPFSSGSPSPLSILGHREGQTVWSMVSLQILEHSLAMGTGAC